MVPFAIHIGSVAKYDDPCNRMYSNVTMYIDVRIIGL